MDQDAESVQDADGEKHGLGSRSIGSGHRPFRGSWRSGVLPGALRRHAEELRSACRLREVAGEVCAGHSHREQALEGQGAGSGALRSQGCQLEAVLGGNPEYGASDFRVR